VPAAQSVSALQRLPSWQVPETQTEPAPQSLSARQLQAGVQKPPLHTSPAPQSESDVQPGASHRPPMQELPAGHSVSRRQSP
jgi:hypothetical protein